MNTTESELMDVTEWGIANAPNDRLIYGDGMWQQIMFVRDALARELAPQIDHTYEEYRALVKVCGYHISKSVKLPVFSIDWKRGIRFTMRNNFHDWGVSIESVKPLIWDFDRLCRPDRVDSYCEGFPADRKFGPHAKDASKFTCGLSNDYDLHTLIYLIIRQFPAAPRAQE